MSCRSKPLARYWPTGAGNAWPSYIDMTARGHSCCKVLSEPSPTLATLPVVSSAPPHQYRAALPARHAHSHSASVGSRQVDLETVLSHLQNAWPSAWLTCTTG